MGETASPLVQRDVVRIVEANALVEKVLSHRSMIMGPEETILLMKIQFARTASADEIIELSRQIKLEIEKEYHFFKQIYIEAG